jgi:hypothetical protein
MSSEIYFVYTILPLDLCIFENICIMWLASWKYEIIVYL